MKKIFINTLVLCIITLVAGLALAVVYEVTKEPIAKAEEQAALNAYYAVFPEADRFEETELKGLTTGSGVTVEKAVLAKKSGTLLGYALTVTSPNGYGGNITIAMGVMPEGSLAGISVISQSETAGLGAKCKDDKFTSQFSGMMGDRVDYTKSEPTAENHIQAISGATITTSAIVDAVNAGLAYVRDAFLDGEGELS